MMRSDLTGADDKRRQRRQQSAPQSARPVNMVHSTVCAGRRGDPEKRCLLRGEPQNVQAEAGEVHPASWCCLYHAVAHGCNVLLMQYRRPDFRRTRKVEVIWWLFPVPEVRLFALAIRGVERQELIGQTQSGRRARNSD